MRALMAAFPLSALRQKSITALLATSWVVLGVGAVSCTLKSQEIPLGSSSGALEESAGRPETVVAMASRPQALSYRYARGESYQVEGGRVVAHLRTPASNEETLQYWMHAWRSVETRYEEVSGSRDRHGHARFQLVAPSIGRSVVYDPQGDRVTQVVEYAEP